jgi:hypothetical protein
MKSLRIKMEGNKPRLVLDQAVSRHANERQLALGVLISPRGEISQFNPAFRGTHLKESIMTGRLITASTSDFILKTAAVNTLFRMDRIGSPLPGDGIDVLRLRLSGIRNRNFFITAEIRHDDGQATTEELALRND